MTVAKSPNIVFILTDQMRGYVPLLRNAAVQYREQPLAPGCITQIEGSAPL